MFLGKLSKSRLFFSFISINVFSIFLLVANSNIENNLSVEYIKKPFYFRFPPKLKEIKGKKVIMAKFSYNHPKLGQCSYQIVKDLERSKFFGWCSTKKIERRKTKIFDLQNSFKALNLSENQVELGLNEKAGKVIKEIEFLHNNIVKKK